MFVCTKVAGATFRLRKGRQQRFRPIDGQPRGACSTVVCKRTATPLADIYDSLVTIIVHTSARTSTTRFAPQRLQHGRLHQGRRNHVRLHQRLRQHVRLREGGRQHRLNARKSPSSRSTTQRSPAAPSSSRMSSTAGSRPRPFPTGTAARSAAGPFSRPLRWASQRTPARSRTPAYTSTYDALAKAWPPGAQARPTAEPQPRCAHKIFTKAPPWHRHERPALVRPH